ncbi:MAG: HAMP domain-containing histidine kinase [Ignavibacteriae bacterium]|nr:sensor histidine kinase [Ignavibacteriota bacterium]NOG97294.1 HAMP domain-containing histidine kinase [Ignavibacteriota bacterium]
MRVLKDFFSGDEESKKYKLIKNSVNINPDTETSVFHFTRKNNFALVLTDYFSQSESFNDFSSSQNIGKKVGEVFPFANNNNFVEKCFNTIETGKSFYDECLKFNDGNIEAIIEIGVHKTDEDKILVVLKDRSRQSDSKAEAEDETSAQSSEDVLSANQILEIALDEAEKANNVKSEFLAQMSHEIRTPITVILSYIGLLKSDVLDDLPEDMRELFPSMERAGRRIIRTIDLLLNVAELNAGSYICSFNQIDLYERVLESIYMEYKKDADAKGIYFKLKKDCSNCFIKADEHTLSEIFRNLIDNAIKYTSIGGVEISIKQTDDDCLNVEITDTGIGISDTYLPNLFEPFSQEEMGYTRGYEGNGLGLALSQKYAKLNGGEIFVESEKGVGSKFIVSFNLKNKK